jgi:hypothetical protein
MNSNVFSTITHGSKTSIRLAGGTQFTVSDINAISLSDLNGFLARAKQEKAVQQLQTL